MSLTLSVHAPGDYRLFTGSEDLRTQRYAGQDVVILETVAEGYLVRASDGHEFVVTESELVRD